MQHSGDEATLSMIDVKKKSDIMFINDANSLQELHTLVHENLKTIL